MALCCKDLWAALDWLAGQHGFTSSGLARLAGLDATTFNKSKRVLDGRERWPSAQSIALVLQALDVSFMEFAALAKAATGVSASPAPRRRRSRRSAAREHAPAHALSESPPEQDKAASFRGLSRLS